MDSTQDTQGTAFGIDFGVLWKVRDDVSLGAVLKFPYTFRKSGETGTEQSLSALTHKTHTIVKMKYPFRIALGGAWDITDRDLLAFGLTWLNWSRYRMLIDYNDEVTDVLEDYNGNPSEWENTIRLHMGYERMLNEKWAVRCGFTYDQAPEPDEYRTLIGGQVVDAWLLTAGGGVDLGDVSINFGYIYTYGPKAEGYIPDAEYSMILHELFIGMEKRF
jgi:long-subunit fatty acid transport protein